MNDEGCRLFFSFRHPKITVKEKIDIGSNNPRKIRSYLCFISFYFRIRVQQEQETCLVSFCTCRCLFKISHWMMPSVQRKKFVCAANFSFKLNDTILYSRNSWLEDWSISPKINIFFGWHLLKSLLQYSLLIVCGAPCFSKQRTEHICSQLPFTPDPPVTYIFFS